jgi:hypothetical protein
MRIGIYHKYNAKRKKCQAGHSHPSMLEADYCDRLAFYKKTKVITEYQYQPRYELVVNGKCVGHHKPDFLVTLPDGKTEIRECKGMVTADFTLRKNLFEALYPEIPYVIVRGGKC